VLVRIEHHQAARVGGGTSSEKNEQSHDGEPDGPLFAAANGNEANTRPLSARAQARAVGHGAAYSASMAASDE